MTINVKHNKVVAVADSNDGKVSTNAWNDTHAVTGDPNTILGFDNLGAGQAVSVGAGLSYSNNALTGAPIATRGALAALKASNGDVRYLTESGREGTFIWSSVNNSANVSADINQGIYVAPASDTTGASGAWVRKYSGFVNLKWFGAVADDNGTTGTDNYPVFTAAFSILSLLGTNNGSNFIGAPTLFVPAGAYYVSQTLDIELTIPIVGEGNGLASGYTSRLRFPAGQTGIRVQRSATSGASGTSTAHTAGDGTIIRGLALQGGFTATEGEFHGIHLRARATIEDCYITGFQGDGIYIDGTSANSNANCWSVNRCSLYSNRNGFYATGGNGNAGAATTLDCSFNRQWGIWDFSFLYNSYYSCHSSANGIQWAGSGVNYNGLSYVVVYGQEAAATTNAPSGTSADNAYWLWIANGTQAAWPTWTSGMAQSRASGSFAATNQGNNPTTFCSCYSESSHGPAQLLYPAIAIGGTLAAGVRGGTGLWMHGGLGSLNLIGANSGVLYAPRDNTGVTWGMFNSSGNLNFHNGSTVQVSITSDGYLEIPPTNYALPSYPSRSVGTRLITANTLGAGSTDYAIGVAPSVFWLSTSGTGDSFKFYAGTTNTATLSGAGVFNVLGGLQVNGTTVIDGSRNSTPASVASTGSITSSGGGVGYAAGSGGAVTQATSKATGVTLNKFSGQITMNAAALASAAKVSFVVTNSDVAATDVVVISVASGGTANAYRAAVTAVAAGSFTVTVENITAGSLSESPVISFAVIKAVAA